jgi:glycosyltransferase involved in cell wall biosynthesis
MKVSVLVLAYNHERFIGQALDSVLMQQADFDWEIVVGEDCSTDGTGAIVREYAGRHPGRIRLLPRERNLGMHRNFADTWAACHGRYVAMLEGDDYWTSPDKLRRQVAFLDARPDYSECFTDVEVFHDDGSRPRRRHRPPDQREAWGLEDLLAWNFIPQCSVMFRRGVIGELPGWFYGIPLPDWSLHLLHAERGKIGYIPEVMGAYRLHPGGIHTSQSDVAKTEAVTAVYRSINEHLGFTHDRLIRARIARNWFGVAVDCADRGDRAGARRYGWRCLSARPLTMLWPYRLRLLLRLYAPAVWRLAQRGRQRLQASEIARA